MVKTLRDPAFIPLPLGQVKPEGWLQNQLQVQAEGLSGHLDEFWPDIAESGWIGGEAEGWERGPYWLDGVIPLAFLLDDAALKEKVHRWMDYILTHQHEDGWLGPVHCSTGKYKEYDPWPIFVLIKAATQYFEYTGDERVISVGIRFFRRLAKLLAEKPLFSWGKSRWADLVVGLHWFYRQTGEEWLLELAATAQQQGFDWADKFANDPITQRVAKEDMSQISHVVNNAMAIKSPGVWYMQSKDAADRESVYTIIETLDRYHGQVTGVFSGDEHLAGKNPSQGTELCAVVEYMYSLELLVSYLGDPLLADRLEQITYNALPATFTPDMWAHQYDQQANQVRCNVGKHVWTTNADDANVFGLEPNFGCCTANMHQGWPKFTSHLWMSTPDAGLAAIAFAPSRVSTEVQGGVPVTIIEETEYPFDETVRFCISVSEPVEFPLMLRIPAWAKGASVTVGGQAATEAATPGSFVTLQRRWKEGDVVELTLPMSIRCERRFNDSVALLRGPLVFSMPIPEEMRVIKEFGPAKDYEIMAQEKWNYGLRINCERPDVTVDKQSVFKRPFDPAQPPVVLTVSGYPVADWGMHVDADGEYNDAAPPPEGPVVVGSDAKEMKLIPYGSTLLRITEFPVVDA